MPQFLITVETPRGSNIAETDRSVRFVESILSARPEVKYYMSNIGKGNPQIFYNSFQKSEQTALGEVLCEVKPEYHGRLEQFIEELRDTFKTSTTAKIYIYEFENGMPVDAPIALRIVG
jgi:multidrug efflux pump subunit AcrB